MKNTDTTNKCIDAGSDTRTQAGRAMMGPLLLPAVLLLVLQTAAAPRGRRVSGATRFASCGDTMCDNMTAQVAQIVAVQLPPAFRGLPVGLQQLSLA